MSDTNIDKDLAWALELLKQTGHGHLYPDEAVAALAEPLRQSMRVEQLEDERSKAHTAAQLLQIAYEAAEKRIEELEAALSDAIEAVVQYGVALPTTVNLGLKEAHD